MVVLGAIIFVVFSYSLYQKQNESSLANGVVDQFCNECQIVFNANGGTNTTNSITVLNEGLYGTLPTPTRNYYTFAGWYTEASGGDKITSSTVVNLRDTQTLYAHWTPTNYTIKYNLGGGTISGQKTSYNIETATFKLPTPIKHGYTFLGWTGSNGTTASTNVSIAKGSTGNKTYTANWKVQGKCVRAQTLHTEICSQTGDWIYCSATDTNYNGSEIKNGDTITYGNLGTKGTLAVGDAFTCDVNGDGVYDEATERFYYVSDYYNGNTNSFDTNYATLIYYNNTTNGVADNTDAGLIAYNSANVNNQGPVTAVTNLPSTSQWKNVSLKSTTRYIREKRDSGTEAIISFAYTNKAARLITYQEIKQACETSIGITTRGVLDTTQCRFFLENTPYSNPNLTSKFVWFDGYWTETPYVVEKTNMYYLSSKFRALNNAMGASNTTNLAVRPVIEVKKTDMTY